MTDYLVGAESKAIVKNSYRLGGVALAGVYNDFLAGAESKARVTWRNYKARGESLYGYRRACLYGGGEIYRIANDALARYEVYKGVNADADLTAAPWETFTTSPHVTAALDPSYSYNIQILKRNKYNEVSKKGAGYDFEIDADGSQIIRPSAPESVVAKQTAGKKINVTAVYNGNKDGVYVADRFVVGIGEPALDTTWGYDDDYPFLAWELETAPFGSGGTTQINYLQDLAAIADDLSGDYILKRNLDFNDNASYDQTDPDWATKKTAWTTGTGWTPIGTNLTPYTGTFYGQGYEIKNLFIDRTGTQYQGLFGANSSVSIIQGLKMTDVDITTDSWHSGGLIAFNNGTIESCSVQGNITGSSYSGLLTGTNGQTGIINKCSASGTVSGARYIGGAIGILSDGSVTEDSYSQANVTRSSGIQAEVAGFVGYNYIGAVRRCYSTGVVTVGAATNKGFCGGEVTGATYADENNFWDTETSLQATSAGNATGKTTAQMKTLATFTGASWSIEAVPGTGYKTTYYDEEFENDEGGLYFLDYTSDAYNEGDEVTVTVKTERDGSTEGLETQSDNTDEYEVTIVDGTPSALNAVTIRVAADKSIIPGS